MNRPGAEARCGSPKAQPWLSLSAGALGYLLFQHAEVEGSRGPGKLSLRLEVP